MTGPDPDEAGRDIQEELDQHIERHAAAFRRQGLPPAEARRRAEARFGSREAVARALARFEVRLSRRARLRQTARALGRDVRDAWRSIQRRPGFAVAVIATVTLAVGIATSLFTIVNALALRPVPGLRADGLVKLYNVRHGVLDGLSGYSYPTYRDLAAQVRSVDRMAAFAGRAVAIDHGAGASLVLAQFASGGYFEMLGTRVARGRLLGPDDDQPGAMGVAVVSHAYWVDRLGADPDVIGRTVRLNQQPVIIVGVAERGFRGPFTGFPGDLYLPLHAATGRSLGIDLTDRQQGDLEIMARLAPGFSLADARADFDRATATLRSAHPDLFRDRETRVEAWSGLDADLAGPVLAFVGILALIAGLIVAIACVNVAGLLLHRGQARTREVAIRRAVGASAIGLFRQSSVETLLLFAVGQTAGVILARAGTASLHGFLPDFALPVQLDLDLDGRVFLLSSVVTLGAAVVFGLLPSAAATRVDPLQALRPTASSAPRRAGFRRLLVASQFAVTLILLVTTGLFVQTLRRSHDLPVGFRPDGTAAAAASVSALSLDETAGRAFFGRWLDQVQRSRGVESAALAQTVPLAFGLSVEPIEAEGRAPSTGGVLASSSIVSPGYFDTLGIPLVAGRDFAASDRADVSPVAILAQSTADRLFGPELPLGRHVSHAGARYRVVGVVGDVAVRRPGRLDEAFLYVPFSQQYSPRLSVVARGPADLPVTLRRAASAVDPAVPMLSVEALPDRIDAVLFPQRMAAALAGLFGGIGLALATVGLYGVVALHAAERRRDIAIRLALGAPRARIRREVLTHGLRQVALGLCLGVPAAGWLAGALQSFLPGISSWNPTAMFGGIAVLVAAAVIAADMPARRAAHVDPLPALRG